MDTTENPEIQIFQLSGVRHIKPDKAIELIRKNQVIVIDVREEVEFKKEYLNFNNVVSHPMSVIMDRLGQIPKDKTLLVLSSDGINSTKVANLLNRQAYTSVANIDGGLQAWKIKGFDIVIDSEYTNHNPQSCDRDTCGCSCEGCS
ncbi:MAG TPA: rhodanese-like domain-containing protein [Bacteroidales bacterium]|nr:rhodanese-like domain-containing protein [Bacteroidales bacterium]